MNFKIVMIANNAPYFASSKYFYVNVVTYACMRSVMMNEGLGVNSTEKLVSTCSYAIFHNYLSTDLPMLQHRHLI